MKQTQEDRPGALAPNAALLRRVASAAVLSAAGALWLSACAPKEPQPVLPPPPAPKEGIVLFEERPADPAVLEAELARRRKGGASPQEIRRIEELLAAARAFAAADGVSAKVPKEKAQGVYDLLRLSAAVVARDTAQELSLPQPLGEESVAHVTPDDRIAAAAGSADPQELSSLLAQLSEKEWGELSIASVWTLSRALAQEGKFADAAARLSGRLSELDGFPSRGELWIALAQWLLAAGMVEEARGALSRAQSDYVFAPAQSARIAELLAAADALSDASRAKLAARLLEAQATLDYGTDFAKALAATEGVIGANPPGDLARRAAELRRVILARSEERARAEVNRLWGDFEAGLSLETSLDRLAQLQAQLPGDFAQGLFARTAEGLREAEINRKLGNMRTVQQRTEALWQKCQEAERGGRLDEAAQCYKELADSSMRGIALERLSALIARMAQGERRKASEQFARALKEKDLAKRLAALASVERSLSEFLEKFPQSPDRARVEKDLSLVRPEIAKTQKAIDEQKALEAKKGPEGPPGPPAPGTAATPKAPAGADPGAGRPPPAR